MISYERYRGILHTNKRYRNIYAYLQADTGCAHTNILISGKWVLSGIGIQKTDTDKSVPTETISIEPYANGLVSKHPDSEYEYANAIGSALPRTT